jgi:hypothetical protein
VAGNTDLVREGGNEMKCDYCPVKKGCKVFKGHSGFEKACNRRIEKWLRTASLGELAVQAAIEEGMFEEIVVCEIKGTEADK